MFIYQQVSTSKNKQSQLMSTHSSPWRFSPLQSPLPSAAVPSPPVPATRRAPPPPGGVRTVDDRRPIGGSGSGGSPGPKNDGKMGICWWNFDGFWWKWEKLLMDFEGTFDFDFRLKQHEATTLGRWGLKLHQENVTNNKPKEYDQQQQLHEKANQSLSEWCLRAVWDKPR